MHASNQAPVINVISVQLFQAFEDIYLPQRPILKDILQYSNYFFAVVFGLEFLLKLIGYGVVGYFTGFWNLLDVFIVAVSVHIPLLGMKRDCNAIS